MIARSGAPSAAAWVAQPARRAARWMIMAQAAPVSREPRTVAWRVTGRKSGDGGAAVISPRRPQARSVPTGSSSGCWPRTTPTTWPAASWSVLLRRTRMLSPCSVSVTSSLSRATSSLRRSAAPKPSSSRAPVAGAGPGGGVAARHQAAELGGEQGLLLMGGGAQLAADALDHLADGPVPGGRRERGVVAAELVDLADGGEPALYISDLARGGKAVATRGAANGRGWHTRRRSPAGRRRRRGGWPGSWRPGRRPRRPRGARSRRSARPRATATDAATGRSLVVAAKLQRGAVAEAAAAGPTGAAEEAAAVGPDGPLPRGSADAHWGRWVAGRAADGGGCPDRSGRARRCRW